VEEDEKKMALESEFHQLLIGKTKGCKAMKQCSGL
jgi:hypothetical protein